MATKELSKKYSDTKPARGRLNKTILYIIFIPALLLLLLQSFFLYFQLNKLIASNNMVIHTEEVIKKTDEVLFKLIHVETNQRAFLITGNDDYLKGLEKVKKELKKEAIELVFLTADNIEQNKRIIYFKDLVEERIRLGFNGSIAKATQLYSEELMSEFRRSLEISSHIQSLGHEIKSVESVLLKERNNAAIRRADNTKILLIISNMVSISFLFIAFLLVSSELSIRQRTEEKNKKSELQLRSIIESAGDMIAAFDKEGCYIIYNQSYVHEFQRLFNKTIRTGMSLRDLIKNTAVEDQCLALKEATGPIKNLELIVNNEKFVYELIVSYMQTDKGEIDGSVHIIRDISKRIHEHEALQNSYQTLGLGMAKLTSKNKQITLLVEMSEIMLACSSLQELSMVMSKYASRMLKFSCGFIFIMHPSKNYLEMISKWGEPSKPLDVFAPNQCWAIRRGRLHQTYGDPDELTCEHILQAEKDKLLLCVPLMAQNDIYGLLYLELNKAENDYIEEHKLLISAFSELSALALANVRLRENLRHQSIRDPLTGLYNRRYLEDFLSKNIHQAERTNTDLSVLMLDLDHFKKLNDTYGHDAGDHALKECAKILQNNIRASDIAARYGGEEFVLILYGADAKAAVTRAKTILNDIAMTQIHFGAQIVGPLTASIGIASFPQDEKNMEDLIEKADKALYFAKNNGRNNFKLASEMEID